MNTENSSTRNTGSRRMALVTSGLAVAGVAGSVLVACTVHGEQGTTTGTSSSSTQTTNQSSSDSGSYSGGGISSDSGGGHAHANSGGS